MNIALAGASGFLGKAILEEALSRGHRVTALVRDPSKLKASNSLEVKQADALDTEAQLGYYARARIVLGR